MKTVTAQDVAERIAQATGLTSDIGLQIFSAAVDFMRDELAAGNRVVLPNLISLQMSPAGALETEMQMEGAAAMRRLLESDAPNPTAIFATTLLAAAGAMRVLREANIRIPEDMSIIAFNDGAIADILAPPLTTIRTPLEMMGYQAAEALINYVEGKGDFTGTTLPETEIIERASTSRYP